MNDMEKILCKIKLRWGKKNGQSWLSNVTLHKTKQISSIFGQKKMTIIWDYFQPCCVCVCCMNWPLSHVLEVCSMGKEQNLGVESLHAQAWKTLPTWLEKFKWDIVSVKKMVWHVPYTIGVPIFSLLHYRWEKQWGYKLTILVCYHI
jgi:hypothetical protein